MYEITWVKGSYRNRQETANKIGAQLYFEQHLNGHDDPTICRPEAIVATNASNTSVEIATTYVERMAKLLGLTGGSVLHGPDRGNWNLFYTHMPAVLLEPFHLTSERGKAFLSSEDGLEKCAQVLAGIVREYLPNGGKVAFSPGHKYGARPEFPDDRGVVANGYIEAEVAEGILARAKTILEASPESPRGALLRRANELRMVAGEIEALAKTL